jgi:formamidopyrimidine-DNA glycosylase
MPELPEVEAVRRALQPAVEGARFTGVITSRPDLRRPFPPGFASRLRDRVVRSLGRRGKYLIAELSSGEVLLMHLGMTGSFRIETDAGRAARSAEPEAHDHVIFRMSSGKVVIYNDPRRFGFMDVVRKHELSGRRGLGGLGVEPLSDEFDAAALARACRGRRTSIKAALSDQRVVAGLGNIYVCEALHQARLSPRRRASSIATRRGAPREAARRLATAIKHVLADAIEQAHADRFRVYERAGQPCRRRGCRGVIRRVRQAGRSTFFCPVCQR